MKYKMYYLRIYNWIYKWKPMNARLRILKEKLERGLRVGMDESDIIKCMIELIEEIDLINQQIQRISPE